MKEQTQPLEAPIEPEIPNQPVIAGPIAPQRLYKFSPRADITPLEAAHCGFLAGTANTVNNLVEHPSWPVAARHFELMEVQISVETQGHEQADTIPVIEIKQPAKRTRRRARPVTRRR